MTSSARDLRPDARYRLVVAGVVVIGLLASLVAARFSGAAQPLEAGLSTAGPVVRWALPLVRVVHDVAASLTVGALLLAATMIPGATKAASAQVEEPRRAAAMSLAMVAAFVWAIAGAVGVVLWFADLAGVPVSDPSFGVQFSSTVWAVEPLRVGLISAITAALIASVAALARARSVAVFLLVASLFAIVVLGLAGHAGGSADHETAVNAIAAHLLAATVWVGGLLALIVLRTSIGDALGVVVKRYSSVALWCFVTLGISGVMSASTRLDGPSDLTTPYGVLILVKAGAFTLLGIAGWRHRVSTIKAIDAGDGGRPFLRLAIG
ncbi:MAG: CopD family protein, partial [Dermatophilaceae bacterium]